MYKKDLSLLVLILVVGAIVAFINPRFLLVGNLSNTANQVGLFGIFSIAEAFVIIVGGIELSVGSVIALLGVLFIDLIVNHDVNWIVAVIIIVACGLAIGVVHGTLVTRMRTTADWERARATVPGSARSIVTSRSLVASLISTG